jgi:hypothetical protein
MMSERSELDELNRVLGRRLAVIRRDAGLLQALLAGPLRGTNRGCENLNLCNLRNLWIILRDPSINVGVTFCHLLHLRLVRSSLLPSDF